MKRIPCTDFHRRMKAFDRAIRKYAESAKRLPPAGYNMGFILGSTAMALLWATRTLLVQADMASRWRRP